jgi:hypothetical protein
MEMKEKDAKKAITDINPWFAFWENYGVNLRKREEKS